jgi:hypothetical protein
LILVKLNKSPSAYIALTALHGLDASGDAMSIYDETKEGRGAESCPVTKRSFLLTPAGLVMIAFLAIGGVYLWIEHRAHLLGALVWLPLLACPLMHLFMHHGHNHSAKGSPESPAEGERK